jgi:hypothetical protein
MCSIRSLKWYVALVVIIVLLHGMKTVQINRYSDLLMDASKWNDQTPTFGPKGWSDVKLLIYMTTHLPQSHVAFLPCWKDAIERLDIFKYADLMLYTCTEPTNENLEQLPFRKITIKMYENPGYQEGAVQSMIDPLTDNVTWFDGYDWVIRINMDVLIRDDKWLMQTMLNTSVDMIVHDCDSRNKHTKNTFFHTDFFAIRPNAIDRERFLSLGGGGRSHAEGHFTHSVRPIFDAGRFAYVEGGKNAMDGYCRIEGVHSPVLHVHELSNYCPLYYNITKEGFYR